jgi:hypothetical protein
MFVYNIGNIINMIFCVLIISGILIIIICKFVHDAWFNIHKK